MKLIKGIIFIAAALLLFTPLAARAVALDAESEECIKCHKTTVGGGTTSLVCHEGGCDHPIGVDYVALASKDPTLRDPSKLDPGIRLFDGKIGCGTCHVPYDRTNHLELSKKRSQMPAIPDPMLSVDNTGSGLCMACHLK